MGFSNVDHDAVTRHLHLESNLNINSDLGLAQQCRLQLFHGKFCLRRCRYDGLDTHVQGFETLQQIPCIFGTIRRWCPAMLIRCCGSYYVQAVASYYKRLVQGTTNLSGLSSAFHQSVPNVSEAPVASNGRTNVRYTYKVGQQS